MLKLNIGNNLLFSSQKYTKYPVSINDENKKIDLFHVIDHPFTINNKTRAPMIRSMIYDDITHTVTFIDQRRIPFHFETVDCHSYKEIAHAIRNMTVRGAPAIGAAGAYGMLLAVIEILHLSQKQNITVLEFEQYINSLAIHVTIFYTCTHTKTDAKIVLNDSRPTAVNLGWATDRIARVIHSCCDLLSSEIISESHASIIVDIVSEETSVICDEDMDICARLGMYGSTLVKHNCRIMHHCNTGSLATVCGGTALSLIYKCFYDHKNIFVYVNETRPRLQGSRLTSWELSRMNIEHNIVVDSCAAHLMSMGMVDIIVVGCDRVAMNGDTANKIGTHSIAVIAKEYGIPMYVVCPVSTIDHLCVTGDHIVVEEREASEILNVGNIAIANPDGKCFNPAFDITPYKMITAFVTEYGICYPPFNESLLSVVEMQRCELKERRESIVNKYSEKLIQCNRNITKKVSYASKL